MRSEAAGEPGGGRRLPRIALLFALLESLRSYLLPLVALLFFSRGNGYETWLAILLVPSAAFALFKYLTFSYRLGADDLVIRSGFLFRQERHIPYSRIQNVDLRQNPLHRLARVAVVRLETGSGGEAEAEIAVLGEAAIAELKAAVFRSPLPSATAAAPDGQGTAATPVREAPVRATPLVELGPAELVLRGLLTGRGWVVLVAAYGFAQQLGFFDFGAPGPGGFGRLPSGAGGWPTWDGGEWRRLFGGDSLLGLLLLGAGLIVASRLLAVVWTLALFWGFRLSRRGDDLTTEQGLLTRVTASLPRHRIQALELRASWLDRLCGRAAVVAATAGRGLAEDSRARNPAAESAELFLAPILRRPEAEALLRELAPEYFEEELVWQGFAPGTFGRLWLRRLLLLSPFTLFAFYEPRILVPLAAGVALSFFLVRRYVARTAWALGRQAIYRRTGRFGESFKIVPLEKIQVVIATSSPFDRRRGTATVLVDTAATDVGRPTLSLPYLPAATAGQLAARLHDESGRRSFRW